MTSSFFRGSIPSRYVSASKPGFARFIISLLIVVQIMFVRQPMQTNADSANLAQEPKEIRQLEVGKPVERKMAGGESHVYQITLAAGQYLNVVVEQRGIDVVVALLGPDGKQIAEFDSESRKQGQETVTQVAEVPGSYRLEVKPKQKEATTGSYEVRGVELRAATERDRALQEARKLNAESVRLYRGGKYDEALLLANRTLEIREKELGPEHLAVARSLGFIASIYRDKGDYEKSESLHHRALAIREKALGPKHPDVANSLNNLAVLYGSKGDYAKAEPLFQRALAIWDETFGPDYLLAAASFSNLAYIYQEKGDYEKSEWLHQRALAIREKALGPWHPEVATSLNNLGLYYHIKGDYEKSELLHQRALAIREKALGPEHPDVANSLGNFALLYRDKGDYGKAEPLFQRALAIWEKTLGPDHPLVAQILNYFSELYLLKGEIAQAVAHQSHASIVSERNIVLNTAIGSERQKLAYLATLSDESDYIVSLYVNFAPNNLAARNLALTIILQRKGRALDAMTDSIAALRRRARPQDQTLFNQLQDTNSQLAQFVLNGPQRTTLDEHQKRIKVLEEQKEDLEAKISQVSDEFRAQLQPVALASVKSAIPADAALVEFVVYRPFNAKYTKPGEQFGPPRYAAYILRPEREPQWVELDTAKVIIDAAIEKWRKALRDPKRNDVKRLARKVEAMVMQPVRALLGETQRMLISPDGALNLIPFAALVDERNRYLVERYSITYLTSGRDLLRLQVARENKSDPLIVADPDFGALSGEGTQFAQNSRRPTARKQNRGPIRNISHAYFEPLPETGREAEALKSLLLLPQERVLTKEQATEAALKKAHAPNILHIATHGFFLEDSKTVTANARIENPLLRSGLVLAGFNQHKSSDDDGALTALEAAGLNLWGTKLVVLSACDTGVGEVKNGEGVYGLRRALVLSGSESQMMSLWSVSDYWTRRLMVGYYTALQQGQGRGTALRQVQLQILKSKTQQHPYYWASFIQSGEWANLDGKR